MEKTLMNLYHTSLMACAALLTGRWGRHPVFLEERRKDREEMRKSSGDEWRGKMMQVGGVCDDHLRSAGY